ncbi:hypothetical protein MBOU_28530 [Mycobacterium bourgelatii]|uniref:Uncharacterized protein n=1 Tax=Mycobacterium bourgelatii TaxID=1273442 RepID=A0A7I9YQ54_MYCBU|nr:hypothetical protein MBOU_28530 [Mycobacterium bourgelatii]
MLVSPGATHESLEHEDETGGQSGVSDDCPLWRLAIDYRRTARSTVTRDSKEVMRTHSDGTVAVRGVRSGRTEMPLPECACQCQSNQNVAVRSIGSAERPGKVLNEANVNFLYWIG